MRIDDDYFDPMLDAHIVAATAEIEAHGSIALLNQTIECTTACAPVISLPVGPVSSDAAANAVLHDISHTDGAQTPTVLSYWVEPGRRPRLHLPDNSACDWNIKLTYTAGFGDDWNSIPQDLRQAVLDQVSLLHDYPTTTWHPRGYPSMSPHAARIVQRYKGAAL